MDETREQPEMAAQIGDIAERNSRRWSTTIIVASAIIGLSIYARPGPPKYQAVAAGNQVVRLNTRTGVMVGCETGRCAILLREHQHLDGGVTFRIGGKREEAAKSAAVPAPSQPPAAPAAPAAPKAQ